MHAIFTKGPDRVRITISGKTVIRDYDTGGRGFVGVPYRETVTDPETVAEECAASFLANGWTLEDI